MPDRARWNALRRPTPAWFRDAPFGIFIHWGAYSVPAWAEPIGELGTVDDRKWLRHNPYAEWYYNTIRIDGSPAQKHHRETYGDVPYDDLLDLWKAERFDAGDLIDVVVGAGADYVVPTTKHHDGITLWDAPETGTRNTVHRGPKRDLVGEIAAAARERGIRLGLYYSGGLDWHVRPMPPHETAGSVDDSGRPKDAEYARYCSVHVRDLIHRYAPDILWNDINWPDEGKHFGEHGLGRVFEDFYARTADGLVNDRWGDTHHDYATSEYQYMLDAESEDEWENCRGIGLSFGYNQAEGPEHCLDGPGIARHLIDVVSRGGHFLLNIGPKADGTIPDIQLAALRVMGEWMRVGKPVLAGARHTSTPVDVLGDGWARVVETDRGAALFADQPDGGSEPTTITGLERAGLAVTSVEPGWGSATVRDDGAVVVEPVEGRPGPVVLRLS